MKKCSKCKTVKSINYFHKDIQRKDHLNIHCKECVSQSRKDRIKKNKEVTSLKEKEYYIKNKDRINKTNQKWHLNNKERRSKYNKEYNIKNKEATTQVRKKWYEDNKYTILIQKKKYYQNHKEKIKEYHKKYNVYNKDKVSISKNKYESKKLKSDPIFKFTKMIKSNVRLSFKRASNVFCKKSRTEEILGCCILDFRRYIENKFTEGMSFENYGKWHLDHIIPISSAKTEEDVIRLCHHTNYQPLWAIDNIKKSNKLNYENK